MAVTQILLVFILLNAYEAQLHTPNTTDQYDLENETELVVLSNTTDQSDFKNETQLDLLSNTTNQCEKVNETQLLTNNTDPYGYIIALLTDNLRIATGSLLTRKWVLTCAHCVEDVTHVQYGNMSIPPEISCTKNEVLKTIQHPEYQTTTTVLYEIGLCKVKSIRLNFFGKLSNIVYGGLVGRTVIYAGYGTSQYSNGDDLQPPLHISEGSVVKCGKYQLGSICVTSNTTDIKYQDLTEAYAGGPVFSDGEIVGVISYDLHMKLNYRITAILPYKRWIYTVIQS